MNYTIKDFTVRSLREIKTDFVQSDTPEKTIQALKDYINSDPNHNAEVENFYVIFFNTRFHIKGIQKISQGLMDTLLVHPREVFRAACIMAAHSIVIAHNHPSGDPTPSESDIRVTRELINAGKILRIEILDHLILGQGDENRKEYCSLRELGYF